MSISVRSGRLTLGRAVEGLPPGPHDCRVVFGEDRRPERLDIEILEPAGEWAGVLSTSGRLERLDGVPFSGSLSDGTPMRGAVAACVNFACSWDARRRARLLLECVLSRIETGDLPDEVPPGGEWVFGVVNLDLAWGDLPTTYPRDDGPGSRAQAHHRRDRIEFDAIGRRWVLWVRSSAGAAEAADGLAPLGPVELRTGARSGDDASALVGACEVLTSLLSLAGGKFVRWTVLELRHAGTVVWAAPSPAWIPGRGHGGLAHVTQSRPGDIREYLESCAATVAAGRLWWIPTIELYLQAGLSAYLEFKLMVLFALLDRVQARVLSSRDARPEIGPGLDGLASSTAFRDALHGLIASGCPEWSPGRTGRLLGELRRWNRAPSYVAAVERACGQLAVPAPSAARLELRHRMLHGYQGPVEADMLSAAWSGLDDAVVMMLLRMLGYRGPMWLQSQGRAVRLADVAPSQEGRPADGDAGVAGSR